MTKQCAANSAALIAGQNVSVTYEIDIPYRLEAHDADQREVLFIAPEDDSRGNFFIQFRFWHVRIMPKIRRDQPSISLSGGIYYRKDGVSIVIAAGTDAAHGK